MQDGHSCPSHDHERRSKQILLYIDNRSITRSCLVNLSDMNVQATELQLSTAQRRFTIYWSDPESEANLMAPQSFRTRPSRREMLRSSACGFGTLALSALMQGEATAASVAGPLAPKPSHFPARAKRVIFLFMHGGPSQVDTFDYKPQLIRDHGKPLPFNKPRVFSSQTGNLLKSPWEFRQYGESGAWVSDLFPNVAKHVDDMCIINGMHGSNSRHGAALLELHTGSDTFVRPSMGAWITYGLGTENESLPGFITICPTLTHGGATSWGSSFLPADYQGTAIGNAGIASDQAKIPFIENADHLDLTLQRQELDFAQTLNRRPAGREPGRIRRWKHGLTRMNLRIGCRRPRRNFRKSATSLKTRRKRMAWISHTQATSDDSA